jgi:hypothetical protein
MAAPCARICVQPRRHINRQHRPAGLIDALDELDPLRAQRPIDADAEQAVYNERGTRRERRVELLPVGGRLRQVQDFHVAVGKILAGATGVFAVIAFPREDENALTGPG